MNKRTTQNTIAIALGFISNVILAILKTSIGVIGHSPALLADGINSTSDVAYYLVIWVFMQAAAKPADDEHPYGHSQLESIGAVVVGAFVITTAISIFWRSLDTLFDIFQNIDAGHPHSQLTLYVAVGTMLLKIALWLYTRKISKTTNNAAVAALSDDHKNDIFTALAASIGISMSQFGVVWVDPLAGAVVSIVVFFTGVEILRTSTSELMDTVPGKQLQKQVSAILQPIAGIERIEDIHAHRFGPYLVINLVICVDGEISVSAGDAIATAAEDALYENIPYLKLVHIHYHPYLQ